MLLNVTPKAIGVGVVGLLVLLLVGAFVELFQKKTTTQGSQQKSYADKVIWCCLGSISSLMALWFFYNLAR